MYSTTEYNQVNNNTCVLNNSRVITSAPYRARTIAQVVIVNSYYSQNIFINLLVQVIIAFTTPGKPLTTTKLTIV